MPIRKLFGYYSSFCEVKPAFCICLRPFFFVLNNEVETREKRLYLWWQEKNQISLNAKCSFILYRLRRRTHNCGESGICCWNERIHILFSPLNKECVTFIKWTMSLQMSHIQSLFSYNNFKDMVHILFYQRRWQTLPSARSRSLTTLHINSACVHVTDENVCPPHLLNL